jgi:hypothetical protein
MLPATKKMKLLNDLKSYKKKYVNDKYLDLDESATRLMINEFLTTILGFAPLDEVKTEYMIRGTYADYVVQTKGRRHFLVEVKAMSIELSDKHLRLAINYAANEGIDWALLTNGRNFDLYRVYLRDKIESKLVFSINLGEDIKTAAEGVQYLTKTSIEKGGLADLWNRISALDPGNVAGLLYSKAIINILKKELKKKYKTNFKEEDIMLSVTRIIEDAIFDFKPVKEKKPNLKLKSKKEEAIPSEPVTHPAIDLNLPSS